MELKLQGWVLWQNWDFCRLEPWDLLREVKGVLRQQADPKILQKIPHGRPQDHSKTPVAHRGACQPP